MVGLIPRILLDLLDDVGGREAVLAVLAEAGLPATTLYRIHRLYPDEEWRRLFEAACRFLDVSPEEALAAFGDRFLADARRRFPEWFRMSRTAREFLLLHPLVHNSFYTGIASPARRRALRDKFSVREEGDDLLVTYRSPNRLCLLYEHLARRVLALYGEEGTVRQLSCLQRGDPECVFLLSFARKVPTDDDAAGQRTGSRSAAPAGHRGDR